MDKSLVLIYLSISISAVAQAPSRPNGQHIPASVHQALTANQAMNVLRGKHVYICRLTPQSEVWTRAGIPIPDNLNPNPKYFDATDADGNPIKPVLVSNYFDTGDKLLIHGARTGMAVVPNRPDSPPTVMVALDIENESNSVRATVNVEIYKSSVTPSRIMQGIVDNTWYSLQPVSGNTFPRIGMTSNDIYCRMGVPDRTNTDARGDDQLVYYGGQVYVYVNERTDRVTNVQTSFR